MHRKGADYTNVLRNHELITPPTKFSKYQTRATKDVCDATMKDAVKEAVVLYGTWQKRILSMNGVVTVTVTRKYCVI
ncbi:hypothetical protein TNCV_919221 [Trichonephila clavipes]|nr:hypothetical protein TNCV_919221 [Trichonephila clavipes]